MGRPRKQPKTIDGVINWLCSTEQAYRPETLYYKNKAKSNGLQGECMICNARKRYATTTTSRQ